MNSFLIGIATVVGLGASPVTTTQRVPDTSVYGMPALSDSALADVRGQYGGRPLSLGTVQRIADDTSRADLRQTGGLARVEMDVWWSSTGVDLIAQSARAAGIR